jgi:anti-anti-sigma regulatory factor
MIDIKSLKAKVRIVFPEECENFMAEETLEALKEAQLGDKPVEIELGGVKTMDTTFVNIFVSLINTLKAGGQKYAVKSSNDEVQRQLSLYGISI